MPFRLLALLGLVPPPAAGDHLENVEHEKSRAVQASAKVHDVIRDFVHSINAKEQREIAERDE